ncbi:MAG: FG-GAP-like repeat-containing protein, partial [Ignavibacteria bacterium]
SAGDVKWGDYDNDGDLDLLISGDMSGTRITKLYKNNCLSSNDAPGSPTDPVSNGTTFCPGTDIVLSWDESTDTETPTLGLSYNLRIGTTPGGGEIINPMSNGSDGYRKVVMSGNIGKNLEITLKDLPIGTYYWSVQAIDASYSGSEFSVENSFEVIPFFEDSGINLTDVSLSDVAWGDYDNDGDLDILLTGGYETSNTDYTIIYNNMGNGNFENSGISLVGIDEGSIAWGDYNNDGDLDILLTGSNDPNPFSIIYQNTGSGSFENSGVSLSGVNLSSAKWGDYDNDGDLDILLCGGTLNGRISKIYKNNGNGTFSNSGISLTGVEQGSAEWGDYDNDGDLDILLTGYSDSGLISKIYKNNGNDSFSNSGISLLAVWKSSARWGDYDCDGDLDILLTGWNSSWQKIIKIYKNNGNDSFEDITLLLDGVIRGSTAWGDYDNDGDLDILLTGNSGSGEISKIYKNNGNDSFSDSGISLTAVQRSSVAWGDYDNDGDLDILLTGGTSSYEASRIYKNNYTIANSIPNSPVNLSSSINGSTVTFSWDAATDNETPSAGLTYNLRIGTTPGGDEIMAPMADASNGLRRIPVLGNTNHNTSWTIKDLSPGQRYYWSVQAIDNCFAGSEFSTEETFLYGVSPDEEPGYALEFDGVDDYVNCGNNSILNIENQITIEAWIYYQGGESFPRIIDKSLAPSIYINKSNSLLGWYGEIGGSVEDFTFPGTEIPQNEWTHIAVTYDGSDVKAYINGNYKVGLSYTGTLTTTSDDLIIGNNSSTNRTFLGKLDEIRIWNIARTATQIRENIHKILDGSESGLIGYWQLNDGTGSTTAAELSGESNGTLNNMDPNSDWVISTVPTGGGSCNSCAGFTNGTDNFGNLTLTTTNGFDNEVDLVFNEIERSPNTNAGIAGYMLDRYYVLNVYGTPGSFSTDLTFTLPEGKISEQDQATPSNLRLYRRESTADGDWTLIASGSEATSTTVKFDGVTSFSQFTIASETSPLPVELVSFEANVNEDQVELTWQTATEVNNYGFEIERNTPLVSDIPPSEGGTEGGWEDIGFVNGNGNSNSPKSYSYTDSPTGGTTFKYRLKQIDFDGAYEYSDEVEVNLSAITEYSLEQNYPNPFNPTTTIKYQIPETGNVTLKIYDILGREVKTLVNETQASGVYSVEFNASQLASGVYIYRLRAEDYVSVKKLMLLK